MSDPMPPDDDLARLPLPLAQLGRRALNAKTELERYLAGYYLWEAALKLLASVAVVEYAERGPAAPDVAERLRALARPSLGHWWGFVKLLVPLLADAGDEHFSRQRDLLLGKPRTDLPRAAGLDAVLRELLEGKPGARSTVRLGELFDRLVSLRNGDLGHGAAGQRPAAHYRRLAPALVAGAAEAAARLDVLAGRRLVCVADVRRLGSGAWLAERFDLSAGAVTRLESLEVPEADAASLPRPGRLYLQGAGDGWRSLHPLVVFDLESEQAYFLNSRVRQRRAEYLCYATGEVVKRDELGGDQRDLLANVLGGPVDAAAVESWAEQSRADEPPAAAGEPPPLRTVGELVSRLGQGGMGVVYRAWQPSLGRQVALKCLLRSGDPKSEARFAREIKALGRVDHPHLVKVFTSGSDGDRWFYAMELVEGADLAAVCTHLSGQAATAVSEEDWRAAVSTVSERQRQKERPIDAPPAPDDAAPAPDGAMAPAGRTGRAHVARAAEVVRQVAGAAHTLHEANVIHRDIKPGNVVLSADGGNAVLLDLGLAQLADETDGRLTRTRQFVGTLRYASPEQLLAAKLDRRADVYSLGATLWELLALRPLFGVTDQTPTPDAMLKIQTGEAEHVRKHNPRVPADLDEVVMKCLEKDRNRRYATAQELADDLGRWLRGRPVLAQPPSLGYLLGKRMRRHRRRLVTAAVGLAAVVLGAALLVVLAVQRRAAEGVVRAALAEVTEHDGLIDSAKSAAEVVALRRRAEAAAERAAGLAGGAFVSETTRRDAERARGEAREAREAAERDQELLDRLLEVVQPRETARFVQAPSGVMAAVSEPSAEEQYAAAFRAWGLDPDAGDVTGAASRLDRSLAVIRGGVAAGLDEWAAVRRHTGRGDWRRLAGLAAAADPDASPGRRELRSRLSGDDLGLEALAAGARAVAPAPTPLAVLAALAPGPTLGRLVEQARGREAAARPVPAVLLLAGALRTAGDGAEAERLLRAAARVKPHESALWDALGQLLEDQAPPRWPEAVECYQAARAANPTLGVRLAKALGQAGRAGEGVAVLQEMVGSRPNHPALRLRLGIALDDQGRLPEAEAEYREALRLRPDDPDVRSNLGNALCRLGRLTEAEAEYRAALGLRPEFAEAHCNLGNALYLLGRFPEAEGEYREALRLKPDHVLTHNNLGNSLRRQNRLREAEGEFREALRLRPGYPEAHSNLGGTLFRQGRLPEAEGECREALRLWPDHPQAHTNLGNTLAAQGRLPEAEAEYRVVLRLKPDDPEARSNLGNALEGQGRLTEAEAEFREALRVRPDLPEVHYNLGNALRRLGRVREAEAEYRATLGLRPDVPEVLCNLGLTLKDQGRFAEALDALRRGHERGSRRPGWVVPSDRWVRETERLAALDERLTAALSVGSPPAGPAEAAGFADLCLRCRNRPAAAARFFADAFAAEPRLAADLGPGQRYNAACAASLAAAGAGQDADRLPAKARAGLRRQALEWLRADLAARQKLAGDPQAQAALLKALRRWQEDAALAGVRDETELAKLPAPERAAWQSFWRELAALVRSAQP